jgi:hypothetical protein
MFRTSGLLISVVVDLVVSNEKATFATMRRRLLNLSEALNNRPVGVMRLAQAGDRGAIRQFQFPESTDLGGQVKARRNRFGADWQLAPDMDVNYMLAAEKLA